MITYRKSGHLRLKRASAPEPPYWAASVIAPYSARRAAPIAIDYLELRASRTERLDVNVCETVRDDLERATIRQPLNGPVLVDAAEFAEVVFRRGEEALRFCGQHGCAPLHLVSTRGALPREVSNDAVIAIATWPMELVRLEALFHEAASRGLRWGVVIPVIYPVTTDIGALSELAEAAQKASASFFAALPIEMDPTARNAVAESLGMRSSDESYDMLFHADPEPFIVATERHIAALANEIGAEDFIVPPGWEKRSNWNAAVLLTLVATRMLAMKQEVETAWKISRSARTVAQLGKPIERIAAAANLSIIESLDRLSVEALTDWLDTGRSPFVDHINKQWRLRRDYGT